MAGEVDHIGMAVRANEPCKATKQYGQVSDSYHECRRDKDHTGLHKCWCGEEFSLPTDPGMKKFGVWGWYTVAAYDKQQAEEIVGNLELPSDVQWNLHETVEA